MILTALLVIGFLVLVSALYVAAELSVVAVRRSRIRQMANEGNWLAARLLPVVDNPAELDRAIAACQIGITVSSLVLGAYGQAALAPVLVPVFEELGGWSHGAAQSVSAVVILVVLTVVHMIVGELLPKSLALEFPTQTSIATIVPLAWSLRLFSPLLYLFNGSGLLLLKLLRIRSTRHHHIHSPGEIDLILAEENVSEGDLDQEDRRRLRRALRLGTRRARDLMVLRSEIFAIDIATPPGRVVEMIASAPFTRIPVHRGSLDQIIGYLHTKDVILRQMPGVGSIVDTRVMELVRPIVTVPADASADKVLVLLREKRAQLGLVVDERGAVVGLISLEDVMSELFGALSDELKSGTLRRPLGKRRRDGRGAEA
jgi:putative hemolysin